MFFCIKSIISTFGTTVITVVGGGKPMGGENNWFCIFEADWGCMVTPAKNRRTPRGASASALAPFF
jgi:hypothetical protein